VFARIATFDGDPSQMQQVVETIRRESESGPPEGVPAKEFLLLTGRDSGKMLGIALFDSEEDLRKGDEALNAMTPPPGAEGIGRRTGVEMFDVAIRMKA
jgi:hypothetical protein